MPARTLIDRRDEFQRALAAWYRQHARRLPWREAPSLYKTVVSEFMLQQTQVRTVLPYFARWLDALPDFSALAAAPEARVLKLWEGLGYYSRARNLHRLARAVVALPAPPRTPEAWRELPGIGPYTAAAITSISFGAPAACVDGNVVRILARLTADSTGFRDSASASKAFAALAAALLPPKNPGDHNQAMMELGATVCFRQNPACTVCPVLDFCAARLTGAPEDFPKLAPKKIEQRAVTRVWCEHGGRLLLHRAASHARRLADLHELPEPAALGLEADALAADGSTLLATGKRGITRYQITEKIHAARLTPALQRRIAAEPDSLRWIPLDQLDTVTLSGPHRRWVTEILAKRKKTEPSAASRGSAP
ncbi:A/G-specific adenine glycosylase [Termitidicoccus mucosus]|uniref:Adenine DNA glycosylase n=1 Tax=Termitidicoccus mucosus TaxID=1184151 RepID=A0A178INC3_9BACT|nr:Fe-S cluster assembly protein HesB [Opitutaceae bacterium TSB47]